MIRAPNDAQRREDAWQRFYRIAPRPTACPYCRGLRICWDGSSVRSASLRAGDATRFIPRIPQRRAKCGACRRSWIVRPPGLVAHKHYQLCVVAKAVSDYLFGEGATQARIAGEHDCSERTVGRWLRWTGATAEPAALQRKILEVAVSPIVPALPKISSLARKARTAARRQMVTRAAQILSLMEVLAAALGLEPPGLRGVIERVLRDRATIATYARPLIPELAR